MKQTNREAYLTRELRNLRRSGKLKTHEIEKAQELLGDTWSWEAPSVKSKQEWRGIAEEEARKNGGYLPTHRQLKANGIGGLSEAINADYELFSDLIKKRGKTKEEWAEEAREWVISSGKDLPGKTALRKMGKSGMVFAMQKRPDLFAGLNLKLRVTFDGRLKEVHNLIKGNKGRIPSRAWMKENGYSALDSYICDNAEKFSKYKRDLAYSKAGEDRSIATSLRHVALASRLCKEYGGRLPSPSALKKYGYSTLVNHMYNNPQLYKHLKRVKYRIGNG